MKVIKNILKCLTSDEHLHDVMFESKDEFVSFDTEAFKEYYIYDERNTNRFEVRYDRNLNRVWFK